MESGGDLLSRAVSSQVPSALKGLTSVFGMGTGGTPSPLPPEIVSFFRRDSQTLAQHVIFCLLNLHCVLPGPILTSTRSRLRIFTTAHLTQSSSLLPWPQSKRSFRPISSSNLHVLPRSQRCPIYLLVFQGSIWNLSLVVSFTLRCFQRLSRPYFASQLCPWQDNCCTSGTSIPVLSY